MKSPELVVHGTASEKDSKDIQEEGFITKSGRANISGDLIYAFEWATDKSRRRGSQSESEVTAEEQGRLVIMSVPEDKSVSYATHTGIEIDDETQIISGYPSKYQSGRRQLAIYQEGDIQQQREVMEQAKAEIEDIQLQLNNLFLKNNIDPNKIETRRDLIRETSSFETEQKLSILQKAEKLSNQLSEKRQIAEPKIRISQENILMSIIASEELKEKLNELSQKIESLESIDFEYFSDAISKIILDNKDNIYTSDINIKEIVDTLLISTVETEIMNRIRTLSMKIKGLQGYNIYNRGEEKVQEQELDKRELRDKLSRYYSIITEEDFDIGVKHLNRYLKTNIKKLLEELDSIV
jgi:hypothetical protein